MLFHEQVIWLGHAIAYSLRGVLTFPPAFLTVPTAAFEHPRTGFLKKGLIRWLIRW